MKLSFVLHVVAVAVVLASAIVPVAAGLDPKLAAVAPSALAVLAIAKSWLASQGASVPPVPPVSP